MKGSKK
ncbi:hypothetical protein CCHL11_07538 [Colletotrichum chlorophyti]|nr:hypothetical protein CCHL11_07538 [Colletotrichum chlorophyti]